MKTSLATAVGTGSRWVSGVTLAQTGGMMDACGGMGGGWMGAYGGLWGPSLLVVVVAAVVVTLVKQEHKERGGPLTVLSGLHRMATAPK
jgi:hypothetical protein